MKRELIISMIMLSIGNGYSQALVQSTIELTKKFVPTKIGTELKKLDSSVTWQVEASPNKTIDIKITQAKLEGKDTIYYGSLSNNKRAITYLKVSNNELEGYVADPVNKEAYSITIKNGIVDFKQDNIQKYLCMDYAIEGSGNFRIESIQSIPPASSPVYKLQSLPGSPFVAFLDFTGDTVSGSIWKGGETIYAPPQNYTEQDIIQAFNIISEDFAPFNINITTDADVFNTASEGKKVQCIYTSNDELAPGSGGIAMLGGFKKGGEPCWAFRVPGKKAGEVGSHEIGHTLGLSHDAISNPQDNYYRGHANWAPIMGSGYTRDVVQWSKGEYQFATNTEDDLSIITTQNGFTYKPDDFGNTLTNASTLVIESNGVVLASKNKGLIETNTDVDVFKFSTGTGNLFIKAKPADFEPDLNIALALLDAQGNILISNNSPNSLSDSLFYTVQNPGVYYISIQGVGDGASPFTGYSDYGSIGKYSVSGQMPSSVTGIEESDANFDAITVFPNPSNSQFTLRANGDFEYSLLNTTGVQLLEGSGKDQMQIGDDLNQGLYILQFKQNGRSKTFKLHKTQK